MQEVRGVPTLTAYQPLIRRLVCLAFTDRNATEGPPVGIRHRHSSTLCHIPSWYTTSKTGHHPDLAITQDMKFSTSNKPSEVLIHMHVHFTGHRADCLLLSHREQL